MAKLSDKQLRKIHAAKEQGITKREVFELDVRRKAFASLPEDQQVEVANLIIARKPLPKEFATNPRITQLTKTLPSLKNRDKVRAIFELREDPKAKEAFLKEETLRLQEFRARNLR